MRRFLIFAASLALLPAMAYAQGRGGGRSAGAMSGMARPSMAGPSMSRATMARPSFARPAMSAPHYAMRAAPRTGFRSIAGFRPYSGVRYVRTRSGAIVARPIARQTASTRTPRSSRAILSEDVPGLGFDYSHYAATHPRGSHGHGHSQGHRQPGNEGFVGAYFPFYGGGYYLPIFPDDDEDAEEAAPAAEPEIGEQQQAEEEQEPAQAYDRPPAAQSSQDYVPAGRPTPQDSDQYVFVRRDGTLFFVVAYAWENGALRYITAEGIRRTVAADTLDLRATQQFNEQRGLNFRMPA
ncbi:MAG: hypothetical protein ACRD51_06615 [Candidatus Acidiferrum sp.]